MSIVLHSVNVNFKACVTWSLTSFAGNWKTLKPSPPKSGRNRKRQVVRACDVVCPLDTAAVTESCLLFSCTSSSFLCAGDCLREANVASFNARGLVGVDKHLFQMVSLVTSMTLPLNQFFCSITRQCRCYSETKTTKYNLKHEGKSHPCHP